MVDLERIGLSKTEVFQTIAALVPTIMYQEKKSFTEAAAKARRIVLRCAEQTELAFVPSSEIQEVSGPMAPDKVENPAKAAAAPAADPSPDPTGQARNEGARLAMRQMQIDRR